MCQYTNRVDHEVLPGFSFVSGTATTSYPHWPPVYVAWSSAMLRPEYALVSSIKRVVDV